MKLQNILISLDMTVNAILGGWSGETMSGRTWRLRQQQPYKTLRPVIDWLFSYWVANHCENSYLKRGDYVPEARE